MRIKSHNHLENKFEAAKSIVKNYLKMKFQIVQFLCNINIKHRFVEISQGMDLICPGYNSIKSQVTRSRRKQLPPNITTFDEILNESKYYIINKIKNECQKHNYVQFSEFLEYFKEKKLIGTKEIKAL
ncbi:hypothetical protein H8356DRAFT_1340352 [Neocallimastix lanati (nom. inval.)]|nr:hypothetical protein H8356DRAFT_1340352 [Neocallimastix sp. JGI-2020a]